nr:hypothetical protein [Tanacetum cinerariifolium]
PASLLRDDNQGEAFPTISGLDAGHDRDNIIKTSALPYESTLRVTSLDADEGSMQQKLQELMDLCTGLQRQQTQMATKIEAQDLEISGLKARIKLLEDKDKGSAELSEDDTPIKGMSMKIEEEAGVEKSIERGSNDTKELVNVLTSMDAANILTSGVQAVSVPLVAGISTVGVPTVSGLVPTGSAIFTTASVVTPYSRHPREILAKNKDFVPMASKEEGERVKRKGLKLEQGSTKKMKTSKEVSKEDLKEMMQLVPVEELDKEDLNQLWALVKETLSIRQASRDKENELWVELKRLFEPDFEDQLWTHTKALMHDPLEWKLYDTCGVHHVFTQDQEIFMLVERDYPLRGGLAIIMICNKLQVENYSQMANDLILKIHNIANSPR